MAATDHSCLTCGLPILENTTRTTCCVKCARLRTRRRNFAHPNSGWRNQSREAIQQHKYIETILGHY